MRLAASELGLDCGDRTGSRRRSEIDAADCRSVHVLKVWPVRRPGSRRHRLQVAASSRRARKSERSWAKKRASFFETAERGDGLGSRASGQANLFTHGHKVAGSVRVTF